MANIHIILNEHWRYIKINYSISVFSLFQWNKHVLFFLSLSLLLSAADHRISQTSRKRHKEKRELHQAELEPMSWWNGQTMTGDWDGRLRRLGQMGITLDSTFATDIVGNPVGGKTRGFAYAGSYGLSLNINFDRTGWKDLDLFSSAVWRTGTSLSQRKINNQFPVQQVFGSQTVKLNELYIRQMFFNENMEIKAGRLDAGNDFLANGELYSRYVNNGFDGNPISIFFNVPFTAYPNSTWGACLIFKPYKRLSMKYAVFNANSDIKKAKYHGVNFIFKSTNGVIWITEWCALVKQEKEDHGMPGNYKVGYFYLTGDERNFRGVKKSRDQCLYLLFDQMIYRPDANSDRGLTPFVSLILAPKNRNLFPLFFNGGLVYKGLFKNRPDDYASFGYIYGKYSSDQAESQRGRGEELQNFETIYELNYWAQINKWFYIVPDFQIVVHPKGLKNPRAYVFGAQIGFDIWCMQLG